MPVMEAPRTQQQIALDKANRLRIGGARFKAEVRHLDYSEGCAMLAEILERKPEQVPPEVGAIKLGSFLAAPRRMGTAKADHLYRQAHILRRSPNLRVRDLTTPERDRLARLLRSRCTPCEEKAA